MNRLWFDVQSLTANAIHNWEQDRSYKSSSTVERRPGFTEQWGSVTTTAAEKPPLGWTTPTYSNQVSDAVLTVVQFRPAWAVQLALRAAGIPHQVVNSAYAVSEATGPLPYMRDAKALVGGGDILQYLVKSKQLTLLDLSSSDVQVGGDGSSTETPLTVEMMEEIIMETLEEVLKVLRFQDNHVWKAVERRKSLKACHGNWFMGHWHVWAEKHAAMASRQYCKIRTVEQAKAKAQRAYAFLEQVMQTKPELFLNHHFSKAGLALFEHIMHALADTHLVTLLHHYPALCRYGQNIWEQYFLQNNHVANKTNPFYLLPTAETWTPLALRNKQDKTEKLSTWQTRLTILAREAASLSGCASKPRVDTVGGKENPESSTPQAESTAEAAVAAYQSADQRWMASVILVAVIAIARTIGQSDGDAVGE